MYPSDQLGAILRGAMAVVVCIPGTASNRHVIGEREIDTMCTGLDGFHNSCVLVNIGRGPCIDGNAVHDALSNGKLFAFGSDVWYHYPKNYHEADGRSQHSLLLHSLPAAHPCVVCVCCACVASHRCPPVTEDGSRDFSVGEAGLHTTLSMHRGGAPGLKDTERRRWQALAKALNFAAASGDPKTLDGGPGSLIGRVNLDKGY